jgi:hypothetical protein
VFVIHLPRGGIDRGGQDYLMATQPMGRPPAAPSSHWYTSSATCNRSYLLAGLRAGVIALILLGILVFIVLF